VLLKSDAPVFIDPSTKSLALPENHVMSIVAPRMKEVPQLIPLAEVPVDPTRHEICNAEAIFQVRLRCDLLHLSVPSIPVVISRNSNAESS
jgi:hypothetical protein